MKRTTKHNLLAGLIALFGVLFSALGQRVFSAERVVIATPSRGLSVFPALVSIRKGFYKNEGLEVEMVLMQPTIAVKALISGDADYLLAWGSAVRAAVTGVPIRAILGMASRPLHVLMARPDIKTPKDLKGKIIGVDAVAGTVDYLARVSLRHFGMEPNKDARIIVIGESATRVTALRAGSIDATPIDVSLAVKAEDEGFKRLLYLGDIIELPLTGIAVMEKQILTHVTKLNAWFVPQCAGQLS
jgi:NitT/TauT family transport system substrate-binding protein